jgi:hypothetical protein
MSSRLRIALTTTALALAISANPVIASARQKLVTPARAQIVDTVSTIFAAALIDDVRKFDSVIARAFTYSMQAPDSTETTSWRSSRRNMPRASATNGVLPNPTSTSAARRHGL